MVVCRNQYFFNYFIYLLGDAVVVNLIDNITWYNILNLVTISGVIFLTLKYTFGLKIRNTCSDFLLIANTLIYGLTLINLLLGFCIYFWIITGAMEAVGGVFSLSELPYAIFENVFSMFSFYAIFKLQQHITQKNKRVVKKC